MVEEMSKNERDLTNRIEEELRMREDGINTELNDILGEDIQLDAGDLSLDDQVELTGGNVDVLGGDDVGVAGQVTYDKDEIKRLAQDSVSTTKALVDNLKSGEEPWRAALKKEAYRHSRVIGYLANDDARVDFGIRRTYVKDEDGELIVIPGMEEELNKPVEERAPKSKIYEREANLNIRYKTPAQQQGVFIAMPIKAYELLVQDLTQEEYEAQGIGELGDNPEMVVVPVPKNNLISVMSTFLPGQVRESEAISANYLTPGAKGEVISADGGQVPELILSATQTTIIDENTGLPVPKINYRVRHSFRRSFWNPVNFIPLREFKYVDLGQNANIDAELSNNLDRWYTDNLFKPGRNGAPSPYETMNAEDKALFTQISEDMGSSLLFTDDMSSRKIITIQHWSELEDSHLRQEELRLPIKVERKPGTGRYVYDVKLLVKDENVEGYDPEQHFTFDGNPRFDHVRNASMFGGETLLTYELVRKLEEEYKASKKTAGKGRRTTKYKAEANEAALLAQNAQKLEAQLGEGVISNKEIVNAEQLLNLIPRM